VLVSEPASRAADGYLEGQVRVLRRFDRYS
jgi:hypothetical protein